MDDETVVSPSPEGVSAAPEVLSDEETQKVTLADIQTSLDDIKIILADNHNQGLAQITTRLDAIGNLLVVSQDSSEGGESTVQTAETVEYTEYEARVVESLNYIGGALTVMIGMFAALAVYRFLKIFF